MRFEIYLKNMRILISLLFIFTRFCYMIPINKQIKISYTQPIPSKKTMDTITKPVNLKKENLDKNKFKLKALVLTPETTPTYLPTKSPHSKRPSISPSRHPTLKPTAPTLLPTMYEYYYHPSYFPSTSPSCSPTTTAFPTYKPSTEQPTSVPTVQTYFQISQFYRNIDLAKSCSGSLNKLLQSVLSEVLSIEPSRISLLSNFTRTSSVVGDYMQVDYNLLILNYQPKCLQYIAMTSDLTSQEDSGSFTTILNKQASNIPGMECLVNGTSSMQDTRIISEGFDCVPTFAPSFMPSKPTSAPSFIPSVVPSFIPSVKPSFIPSFKPTLSPSVKPTFNPTIAPSLPTVTPTFSPSAIPSTSIPSMNPTFLPSVIPTRPTSIPTVMPTEQAYLNVQQNFRNVDPNQQCNSSAISEFIQSLVSKVLMVPKYDVVIVSNAVVVNNVIGSFLKTEYLVMLTPQSSKCIQYDLLTGRMYSQLSSGNFTDMTQKSATSDLSCLAQSRTDNGDTVLSPLKGCIRASNPTVLPSRQPSKKPSFLPSFTPSISIIPSFEPSFVPTFMPTITPSSSPSINPTVIPSISPSVQPIYEPSSTPSYKPTYLPSTIPSITPSLHPNLVPTVNPSFIPSSFPTFLPSNFPTITPTFKPSIAPSTNTPSFFPSVTPSVRPSAPTSTPTVSPTEQAYIDVLQNLRNVDPNHQCNTDLMNGFIQTVVSKTLMISKNEINVVSATVIVNNVIGSYMKTEYLIYLTPQSTKCSQHDYLTRLLVSQINNGNFTATLQGQSAATPELSCLLQSTASSTDVVLSPLVGCTAGVNPTLSPTLLPTKVPSNLPSIFPSSSSVKPTYNPSVAFSVTPSAETTNKPISTSGPTRVPSFAPFSFGLITRQPTIKSVASVKPTMIPSTLSPTISKKPLTAPTVVPTNIPVTSNTPSLIPSRVPSIVITKTPTFSPTNSSTNHTKPSYSPSRNPSFPPTFSPSVKFGFPTIVPTTLPSYSLTPTKASLSPSSKPSFEPSAPTLQPTYYYGFSVKPSRSPSETPITISPTITHQPTCSPTVKPSTTPSSKPSVTPSLQPNIESSTPSVFPSVQPSNHPTIIPSYPSYTPTLLPTFTPSFVPSVQPSNHPTISPSSYPSCTPTLLPTVAPSSDPSYQPTTGEPSVKPSFQPTTSKPTYVPTLSNAPIQSAYFKVTQIVSNITQTTDGSNLTLVDGPILRLVILKSIYGIAYDEAVTILRCEQTQNGTQYNLQVVYKISFRFQPSIDNPYKIYENLKNKLNISVVDGSLTLYLEEETTPTQTPTKVPTTYFPSNKPTFVPSKNPSLSPSTITPTAASSFQKSSQPTTEPTISKKKILFDHRMLQSSSSLNANSYFDIIPVYGPLVIDTVDSNTNPTQSPLESINASNPASSSSSSSTVILSIVLVFVFCLLCIAISFFCYRDSGKFEFWLKPTHPKYNGSFYNSSDDDSDIDSVEGGNGPNNKRSHERNASFSGTSSVLDRQRSASTLERELDLARYDRPITISEKPRNSFLNIASAGPKSQGQIKVENNPLIEKIRRDSTAVPMNHYSSSKDMYNNLNNSMHSNSGHGIRKNYSKEHIEFTSSRQNGAGISSSGVSSIADSDERLS